MALGVLNVDGQKYCCIIINRIHINIVFYM